MLLVLFALAHGVAGTTVVDLSQDWAVAIDANAEAALDAVVEEDILAYSLVHGGKIVGGRRRGADVLARLVDRAK